MYRSSIHEEGGLPAELLHRQLQQSGLRDGPFIDVQSSLRTQQRGNYSVKRRHSK